MSSLADLPELIGFFSYSREDDESYKGRLSALREGIQHELSAQLGRTKATFRLWQDREAIAPGKLWETEIKTAVAQSVFFIPIVTPRAVNSQYCQFEFQAFLERELALGRTDLVFPILYVPVPALEDEARWRDHAVLSAIGRRQYVDWRKFRYSDVDTPVVREAIADFCYTIVKALNDSWLSPEERMRQEEAEAAARAESALRAAEAQAKQRAEEEARRQQQEVDAERRRQEAEAKQRAEEETRRRRQEAEAQRLRENADAKRRKEDDERRQRAETETAAWARLPRPLTADTLRGFLLQFPNGANAATATGELQSLQRIDQAFEAAKRADTLAAINAFLAEHHNSGLALKALDLRDRLAARENAYSKAIASTDTATLAAFLDQYPRGDQADDVRRRLKAQRRTDAYKRAMTGGDVALLKSFLAVYPGDAEAPAVRARLRELSPRWPSRRALVIGGATGVGAVGIAIAGLRYGQPGQHQESRANAPSSPTVSKALVKTLVGHDGEVYSADFSPDASRVITRSYDDRTSRLWDTKSGATIATFAGVDRIHARFSRDGTSILTASAGDTPRIWDGRTGVAKALLANAWGPIVSDVYDLSTPLHFATADFSPDSSRIVTAADWEDTAKLWDAKSGAMIATLSGHSKNIVALFSADSERLVTFSINDSLVRLWDGKTGAAVARLSLPRGPVDKSFRFVWSHLSPDSSRLVVTVPWENAVRLYNGKTGAAITTLSGHTAGEARASFSPDSARIMTVAGDYKARLWDAKNGAALATLNLGSPPSLQNIINIEASFSPDGGRIVTTVPWERTATLWDGKTGRSLATLSGHSAPVITPSFSPDSSRLATGASGYITNEVDRTVRLWNVQNGTAIATVSEPSGSDPQGASVKFGGQGSFSPDSNRFLTWSDRVARLWDARSGNAFSTLIGHTGAIQDARFSPDSRLVITLSNDKTARLWDATSGEATAGKS